MGQLVFKHMVFRMGGALGIALCASLAGCGDDDSSGTPSGMAGAGSGGTGSSVELSGKCRFRGEVTGAVSDSFPGNMDLACLSVESYEGDSGIDSVWTTLTAVSTVGLDIDQITEGDTGDFPARLTVNVDGGPHYSSEDCTVTVTSNDFEETVTDELGEKTVYRLKGTGSCTGPLTAPGETEDVSLLGGFSFVGPSVWRK